MRRRAADHASEADDRIESTGSAAAPGGLRQLERARHGEPRRHPARARLGQRRRAAVEQPGGDRVVEPRDDDREAQAGRVRQRAGSRVWMAHELAACFSHVKVPAVNHAHEAQNFQAGRWQRLSPWLRAVHDQASDRATLRSLQSTLGLSCRSAVCADIGQDAARVPCPPQYTVIPAETLRAFS